MPEKALVYIFIEVNFVMIAISKFESIFGKWDFNIYCYRLQFYFCNSLKSELIDFKNKE